MKRKRFVMILCVCILLTSCSPKPLLGDAACTDVFMLEGFDGYLETHAKAAREAYIPKEQAVIVAKDVLVKVKTYIPTIQIELKYATSDNFTGKQIYDFTEAYLRYGTVLKLREVQKELYAQGLSLKIWDGFRPVSAQFKLWEAYPVNKYVANPNTGYSSHSRGNTVDITITDLEGNDLEMPTGFDSFSTRADRNYSDCTEEARENALLLENLMKEYGFEPYYGEWWHYADSTSYPVEKQFEIAIQ